MNSFVGENGAESLSFDLSRSNIPIPANHTVEISTLDSAGQVAATASFPASNTGGQITLNSPASADNWLLSNSAGAYGLEIELQEFGTYEHEGENIAIVELKLNETVIVSKGELWTNAGCEFSGSEACGAGF